MKRIATLLAFSLLLRPVMAAEPEISATGKQNALEIGIEAGKKYGDAAFLLRLVTTPQAPLRIGFLPPLALSALPTTPELSSQTFNQLSQELTRWNWQQVEIEPSSQPAAKLISSNAVQPAEEPPDLPFNQQLMSLADQHGLDMLLSVRLDAVNKGYWALISLYSGADGSLLHNAKRRLSSLTAQALSQALVAELKPVTTTPPVKDFGTAGGSEFHLRSTPPGLHAYLDDAPAGLTPLILRQLTPGQHQLRLFEPDPYLIERIRIVSDPPGVLVKVNDRQLGRTPLDFPAELMVPGRYEIDLSTESRDRFEAQIQIQTKPDNIPVQLNQLPVKRTPVTFQELAQNHYSLLLAPNRAIDLSLPLDLPAAEISSRQVDAYKYAKLKVTANVSNAQVSIDKEVVGETPYTVNLAQGQHTIQLSKKSFRTQEQTLVLDAGEVKDANFVLRPRSTDTSIFLTPTAELTPMLNIGAKYLTFGNLTHNSQTELAHLYGLEIDYGWPDLVHFLDTFDLGLELSGFVYAMQTASLFRNYQGLGAKLQLLRENDQIPISAAIGTYLNIDFSRPKIVGFLSLSRNFGDFALHLGLQTHGFNLNLGYTGFENIRLGLLLYSDTFFKLLSESDESLSTFYGLEAGYSF